jgi:hypothetical protein
MSFSWPWEVKKKPPLRDLEVVAGERRRARSPTRGRRAEARLQHLEERGEQERVVVEVGVEVRAAVLVGREQLAVLPQRAADELERAARRSRSTPRAEARGRRAPCRRS